MKNYFKKSSIKPAGTDLFAGFEIMSRIEDLAPSDAKVSAIIHRLADGTYHTRIPVLATDERFSRGKFYGEAKTNSMMSSLRAAQIEALRKLREWKANRF